mmetsp:Transcript_7553/g.46426  ORF Transcript_7553/g.46426 Transcript_7553/m.46426 type:complete len:255 (+) Transcript_7553:3680-4444(+)
MGVDFELGQFLDQPFGFVEGQELRDAHADEGGHFRVFELHVDFLHHRFQFCHFGDHLVFPFFLSAHHFGQLSHHSTHHRFEAEDFVESFFQHGGKLQQPQRVSSGGSVKHDGRVIHGLHLFHDFSKAHCFVDPRDGRREICEESIVFFSVGQVGVFWFWIHFHGVQVVESIHQGGMACELLTKRVAEVVRRIRGDDQDALTHLRQLHGQAARRRGLSHATLSADEDPFQGRLVQHVLQRGRRCFFLHSRPRSST